VCWILSSREGMSGTESRARCTVDVGKSRAGVSRTLRLEPVVANVHETKVSYG
jgi:hypothetical protein